MIKAMKQRTIIWMNHVTTIVIVRQTSLTTNFTNKLNLYLIQAVIYIQWFQLKIHHKSDKQNTVSDILSRLSYQEAEVNKEFILNIFFIKSIYIFHVLITEVSNKFKISVKEAYKHDSWWKKS